MYTKYTNILINISNVCKRQKNANPLLNGFNWKNCGFIISIGVYLKVLTFTFSIKIVRDPLNKDINGFNGHCFTCEILIL